MRFTNVNVKFCLVVALLAMTFFVTKPASTASATASALVCPGPGCVCFPSCSETDGRFLSLAGGGLAAFVGGAIEIGITSPALAPTVTIGVFDPNTTGLWDTPTVDLQFDLVADPNNDGTGTTVLATNVSTAAPVGMDENAWWDLVFPNVGGGPAQGPGGNFSYFLRITPIGAPNAGSINAIKVRTDGSFSLTGQTIQFIVPADEAAEFAIIGGIDVNTFQCPIATTYDGSWEFQFQVLPNTIALELWDGEFDFGTNDANPAAKDTDDPNTSPVNVCVDTNGPVLPNCTDPNIPLWAQGSSAKPEGIAQDAPFGPGVGSPPDDNGLCAFRRSPGVTYSLIGPGGITYTNSNPSGTSEWEKFSVATSGATNPDFVGAIPAGTWTLRIEGMDVFNQFALHFNRFLEPTVNDSQGCSPGYWKQSQHFGSYPVGVTPNSLFTSVGFENAFPGKTFLQVLSTGGGGLTALGRIIAGAYLNAATVPGFPFTAAQVVADFNAVYPGGNYDALKSKYEALQDPCPFDRNPGQ